MVAVAKNTSSPTTAAPREVTVKIPLADLQTFHMPPLTVTQTGATMGPFEPLQNFVGMPMNATTIHAIAGTTAQILGSITVNTGANTDMRIYHDSSTVTIKVRNKEQAIWHNARKAIWSQGNTTSATCDDWWDEGDSTCYYANQRRWKINATGASYTTGFTVPVTNGSANTYQIIMGETRTPEEIARDAKRAAIRAKLRPRVENHRGQPLRSETKGRQWDNVSPAEAQALQLLRGMVGPEEFRRYLKHGFVQVRGLSGLCYQIGKGMLISVWDKGEKLCTLCVHLKDSSIPATDAVVAKLLIAEMDEPDLWKRSNVNWVENVRRDRPALKAVGRAA